MEKQGWESFETSLLILYSMRILTLSNRYPPYIKGGYEVACFELTKELQNRGHEVVILTGQFGVKRPTVENGILRVLHRFDDSYDPIQRTRWEIEDIKTLRHLIKRFRPEAIYVWNLEELFFTLNLALKESGVPVLYNIQDSWLLRWVEIHKEWGDFWYKPGSNSIKQAGKTALRFWFKRQEPHWLQPISIQEIESRYFVFVSDFRKQQHLQAGFPVKNAPVIYNGVDLKRFSAKRHNGTSNDLRLLYAGRLEESKGVHTIIESAKLLQSSSVANWSLSIYGVPEFPYEYVERLHELVRANQLCEHVKFFEPVTNDRMPDVYAQHDVLLLPSIAPEGFSVTLIEAMASGLMVIGTTSGGSAEILRHEENSLTFVAGNAEMLMQRISRLIADPDLHRRLATAGMQLVHEKFSLNKMVDDTEKYLLKVVSR